MKLKLKFSQKRLVRSIKHGADQAVQHLFVKVSSIVNILFNIKKAIFWLYAEYL